MERARFGSFLVPLVLCAMLAGGATAVSASAPVADSSHLPPRCPPAAGQNALPESWRAAHSELAPSGAVAIRLCRYSGLNAHPRMALARSRLLRSRLLVRRLVSEFDRLPAPPKGAFACPSDDGSQITAELAYAGRHRVMIRVGLGGCDAVTNGSVQRSAMGFGSPPAFGPRLIADLKRLTRAGNRRTHAFVKRPIP